MPYSAAADYRTGSRSSEMVPARNAFVITPSDTVDMTLYPKAMYVGVTGDITYIPLEAADDVTFITIKAHPVGYTQFSARRIRVTGTTATNLIGFR